MEEEGAIAVVGIGCSFPGGEGLDNFWKILLEGKNCAFPIPNERFNSTYWYDADNKPGKSHTVKAALIDGFNELDLRFFGVTEAESDHMDPQQKLLLHCTYRALESAGMPMEKASGTTTGVYIGLMNRDYDITTARYNPNYINHWTGTGKAMSIAANRISYTFNFTGPSVALDSACSSSLVALHFACQAIKQGDCEMAVCGGVSCIIEPQIFVALSKAKMISPEGTSKPFSSRADGYGRGEGCGVILLKPLKQALKDCDHIWGIISKTEVNQDGHTVTPITKPSMVQQEKLLHKIYSESDVSAVQYIEAHGTGTPVGDPIEAGSISKVIAKARPPSSETLRIGSVKGNIGHTESAAGIAGLIKVLLMMKHETIVPSLFYSKDSASIDAEALHLKVPTEPERWGNAGSIERCAGINNFGFGGTNAHTIIRQYKNSQTKNKKVDRKHEYFVLSASSEKSLIMIIQHTMVEIITNKMVDLQSLSYTSACRRSHLKHKYRKAFATSSLTDLGNQLKSTLNKKISPSKLDPRLVFVFCGNGVAYKGMCMQLLKHEPVFKNKVREIETLLQRYQKICITERLESALNDDDFSKPDVVQPLLFAIQVGIVSLFKHWGIKPDAILGHSVGEVAAAHCSGLLSLDDAVKVIYFRSTLQSKVTGGKMLVVSNMAVSEVVSLLPSYSNKICLAAFNSPQSCTLSGDADAIDSLHQKLKNSDKTKTIFLHVLDVPAAYHSHTMDPILCQIEDSIGSLHVNDVETELFSTVTGKEVQQPDFSTGKYWAKNIREPVSFEQAVRSATKENKNVVFVEIGPRRALQRNIQEILGNETQVLTSVQQHKDHETMLNTVSKLFELGFQVHWDTFYRGCETSPTSFPRYQFDCVKNDVIFEAAQQGTSTLESHPVLTQTGNDGNSFSCDLTSASVSYLQDHQNNGVAIVPGALYAELGLAAFMTSVKPKVPLNTLQLSVSFNSPFLITPKSPEMSVKLDHTENETTFKIQSPNATYASGRILCKQERLAEEKYISLDSVYKRCTSTMRTNDFYNYLSKRGFQYGSVFRNKGDVYYGEELREAITVVKVPEELLPQLHEFCIHPVVLDYLLQLTSITIVNEFMARPGFPAEIGSLTVHEPLRPEMVLYLRATNVTADHFTVSGCFTNKSGQVLVELNHVIIKYLGSQSHVVEEYFFHNDFTVVSEVNNTNINPKALVFADQMGISEALHKHFNSQSHYISVTHANHLLNHGFKELLSKLKITNLKSFDEILFVWSNDNVTTHKTNAILDNMVNCCEIFRQIVLELKSIKFPNSIRAITYRSAETSVDCISAGFAISGMTRSCAAELSDLSFQLIDINSISTEDIHALTQIFGSFPCSKYPELVVKNGQILKPYIVHTPTESNDYLLENVHFGDIYSLRSKQFIIQTADPYKMANLSAVPTDVENKNIQEKSIEIQLSKVCVHSSDFYPVSVSDLNFGQTMYWHDHTSQNHQILALDFGGTVTAIGKDVSKLKVGDHVVACYPIAATSKIVIPEAACYNTKRLTFLKEAPCVSYFVLAWEVLHCALPKGKQQRLGIISSFPDSCLTKVFAQTASKSGWHNIILPHLSEKLENLNKLDAFVLLPPFDKFQFEKACNVSGVRHVVAVCKNELQFSISHNVFRHGNDNVRIQTVQMSSILEKGYIRAEKLNIYRWLKSMHLNKKSLNFEPITFQRTLPSSADYHPFQECESYFSSKTLPVVEVGKDDTRSELSDIPLLPTANKLFQKNSVYIVTGGLTGLGLETVKFIAQRGGGCIVILSRSSPLPDVEQEICNIRNQYGATVVSLQCDVSISAEVAKTIKVIVESFPVFPIRGVFHSAVVLHDGLIETLDRSLYEKVLKPKVNGALNLHHSTKHWKLDYFVCYSSISAFIGNASQTNYCAANSFLDMFCLYRRNLGLAGQSIIWGALNLGLLLNKDHFQRFLAAKGMMIMEAAEIHQSLEQCLLLNRPQQVVCKFNFKNLKQHVLSNNSSLRNRLGTVVEEALQKSNRVEATYDRTTMSKLPGEYVRSVLSETLGVEHDELNDDTSLTALGIDSMLALTLQNLLFQDKGVNIPLVKLLDPNSTLSTLVEMLKEGENQESQNGNDIYLELIDNHEGETYMSTVL